MFRNRVVFFFMIYYFKAIKSLVDTKAKNSLTPYPAPSISEATAARPRAALPFYAAQKGILILLTEVVEEIMEKIKTPIMIFFFLLPGKALLQYDRLYDKWHIWKAVVVEDVTISCAANTQTWPFFFFFSFSEMQLFAPLMHWLFLMQGTI